MLGLASSGGGAAGVPRSSLQPSRFRRPHHPSMSFRFLPNRTSTGIRLNLKQSFAVPIGAGGRLRDPLSTKLAMFESGTSLSSRTPSAYDELLATSFPG